MRNGATWLDIMPPPPTPVEVPDKSRRTLCVDLHSAVQHNARWRQDNCDEDDAVNNARQLALLLTDAGVPVVTQPG
jgi:hypothetical protein